MFSTAHNNKHDFQLIEIRDHSGKTYAEIIPSCGGILHSFNVWYNNGFLNVVDGYNNKTDFKENVTAKGFKGCKLSPFACRIRHSTYPFEGKTYTADKFILNGHAIHGLIYDAPFTVIQQQADENSATVVLKYEYRATEKGYPFNYDCIISYQLKPNNELVITTEIINRDEGNIPIQDGWHPYFTLGKSINELELTLRSSQQIVFDKELIPTGELKAWDEFYNGKLLGTTFFDDCFLLDLSADQPLCVLKDVEHQLQVEIRPAKSYPYLQLYTPPHRNSIAIENLSAPPDTFNNGINLSILAPGESSTFETSYIITLLK
ncbi:MAG: aldose 1-epimerase [Chitinophagaceae bacterium]|nr:aldose 1-epimerase [Chitinophagaceae bacterium]